MSLADQAGADNKPIFSGGFEPRAPSAAASPRSAALDASTGQPRANPNASGVQDGAAASLDVGVALARINDYRKRNGLKPLKLDAQLTEAAKSHSRDLAKWDRISHYGSDGSNPWDRVKRVGFKAKLAAENVGTGQANFDEVLEGWRKSEGHNKNLLLPDATHMGIALVTAPETKFKTFWTLVLGTPSS
ncbi:MAG: CAP domain-containing protein [Hyphomicrobiaceae bacterium]